MEWWIWFVLGLVLLGAEALTPGGFFVFFFGIAGIAVSLLVAVGLTGSLSLQVILFSLFAVISLLLFRRPIMRALEKEGGKADRDEMVGATCVANADLAPGAHGKVEARGTTWNAVNIGEAEIKEGKSCTVVRVKGLTFEVRQL